MVKFTLSLKYRHLGMYFFGEAKTYLNSPPYEGQFLSDLTEVPCILSLSVAPSTIPP